MPKIKCICEHIIGLSDIPSPNQSYIVSDEQFDEFQETLSVDKLVDDMKIVAHCSNCGRLHIFWEGFNMPQTIYKKEG